VVAVDEQPANAETARTKAVPNPTRSTPAARDTKAVPPVFRSARQTVHLRGLEPADPGGYRQRVADVLASQGVARAAGLSPSGDVQDGEVRWIVSG
jgi:hypothetical protein